MPNDEQSTPDRREMTKDELRALNRYMWERLDAPPSEEERRAIAELNEWTWAQMFPRAYAWHRRKAQRRLLAQIRTLGGRHESESS